MNAPFANFQEEDRFQTVSSRAYRAPGSIMAANQTKLTAPQKMFAQPATPESRQSKSVLARQENLEKNSEYGGEMQNSSTTDDTTYRECSIENAGNSGNSQGSKTKRPLERLSGIQSFQEAVEGETMARCIAEMSRNVGTGTGPASRSGHYAYNLRRASVGNPRDTPRDTIKFVVGPSGRAEMPRAPHYTPKNLPHSPQSLQNPPVRGHMELRRQMSAPVFGKSAPPPKPPRRLTSTDAPGSGSTSPNGDNASCRPRPKLHEFRRLDSAPCGMPAVEVEGKNAHGESMNLNQPPGNKYPGNNKEYHDEAVVSPWSTRAVSARISTRPSKSEGTSQRVRTLSSSSNSSNSSSSPDAVTPSRPMTYKTTAYYRQASEPAFKPQSQTSIHLPVVANSRELLAEERFSYIERSHCTKLKMPKSKSFEFSSLPQHKGARAESPSHNSSSNKNQVTSKIPVPKALPLSSHSNESRAPVKPIRFTNAAFMFSVEGTQSAPTTPFDAPSKKESPFPSKIPVSSSLGSLASECTPRGSTSSVKSASASNRKYLDSEESGAHDHTGGEYQVMHNWDFGASKPTSGSKENLISFKQEANTHSSSSKKAGVKRYVPSSRTSNQKRGGNQYTSLKSSRVSKSLSLENVNDALQDEDRSSGEEEEDTDKGTLKADGTYNGSCKRDSGSGFARYLSQMSQYTGKTGPTETLAPKQAASLPNRYKRTKSWEAGGEPLLGDSPVQPKQAGIGSKLWGFTKKSPLVTRKFKPNKIRSMSDSSPKREPASELRARYGYSSTQKSQYSGNPTKSPVKPPTKGALHGLRRMLSRESLNADKAATKKKNGNNSKGGDYYGVCKACGLSVYVGEEVSLPDSVYHTACFKCSR
ncbi:uncharacterized protein LOC119718832 [Patiria miniata]|uniref:Uncharacterized protein n=1 Tax=Patiria miniata TaxID=46514 RepID=A0A913YXB4_PATMI|nr:uncharacterized protein LOC119718832 [Patiria miniata]